MPPYASAGQGHVWEMWHEAVLLLDNHQCHSPCGPAFAPGPHARTACPCTEHRVVPHHHATTSLGDRKCSAPLPPCGTSTTSAALSLTCVAGQRVTIHYGNC